MKLDQLSLLRFKPLLGRPCVSCGRSLRQTIKITLTSRPNDEWELGAECSACGQDYSGLARTLNALGEKGNQSLQAIVRRMA